ncbi:DUF1788 domain-containing protein [Pseudomaricurvus alcaniphilus]|uniref:BREX protein BrxB domain-containing protein n=1 Tax=Pseudomaricurvus alcaniphilus TaxID=1166482 RepID=UPI00140A7392|nr:BREX protein BrxB domain-containing protein [Pseudomaricurvus alcaniphilus]NHN36565.1 DUF1788 domain-containing protein [Pseudomaricurvus alcaniphilus]
MSSRIARLVQAYQRFIELPWESGLAGAQKVIFAVYDKHDELKIRANVEEFELATRSANHGWRLLDITDAFPQWMAAQEYREGYFQSPADLQDILKDFTETVAAHILEELEQADADTVVALQGVAGVFGFGHCSEIIAKVAGSVQGRLLVLFPGEYENNNYRLLDARPGWNYLAVPITARNSL